MPLRKSLSLIFLMITGLCLVWGLAKFGLGMALTAGLVTCGGWWLAYKWPSTWLPSMTLVLTVGLAVVGLCLGATALLMLTTAVLGLVNWDLALMNHVPADISTVGKMSSLEQKHFQSLLLALVLALPVMLIGRLIHFHIPFGIMILLAIVAFFGLTRVSTLFSE